MGWQDRTYYKKDGSASSFIWGRSATYWLILICVVVFVADALFGRMMGRSEPIGNGPLFDWGHFSATKLLSFHIWRLITFQFLHGGLGHLLFNMISLFFFGRIVETYLGRYRYLIFYLLGGVSGVILYMALWALGMLVPHADRVPFLITDHGNIPMVGASAGLFALMMAAAYYEPMRLMWMFFSITITLRTLTYILMIFSIFVVMVGGNNVGGEAAHLGGAIFGAVAIRYPGWMGIADKISKRFYGSPWERKMAKAAKEKERRETEQQEVDRILDKVRANGLQSLSAKEKKILNRATERAKHDEPDFRRR